MLPHTRIIVELRPGISSELTVPAMKALIRVISPASADSAKAAVGFGDVFTAKVHPDRKPSYVDYQQTVTLTLCTAHLDAQSRQRFHKACFSGFCRASTGIERLLHERACARVLHQPLLRREVFCARPPS